MKATGYRKGHLFRILAATVLVGLWWFFSTSELSYTKPDVDYVPARAAAHANAADDATAGTAAGGASAASEAKPKTSDAALPGVIMPSMPDPEAKKELGRASWKYFHTLLARFPDDPTEEQRSKLASFIQLYAELYPCGECSHHFVEMLKENPPQTSSRVAAAMWGCHLHNIVNQKLQKPTYDCSTILEDYDCGCGDGEGRIRESMKLNKVSVEKEGRQGG
ncbi:ERV2 (YPR037C) [Zygosaccharomyces parabailii]|uniref:Sulfhydryl oxidase n=1 Tax=Zygosaccharomyces bailii (strain CLIB 213 / ATCC 58445 / CBS 680 / BCRC 21525 / NBRC 1098 / NCYC 1416 / NRRL Y-2227) TaxID=1333698 RepID=A0A8J2XBM3_ZYGB2|nr:ERV2 (YPR037C) [Zygosaccharomyces parabailii]CDF90256.1 ZYBA0S06-04346g1_1 [Zygosaccharomyces bailii CLIB 213]CDH11520.1 related to FAD-linked sulfhydryl oxidase ERV2 [Zygosaccharomyces bailii ISA1307]SJM84613.1 related to FAD-linked sulfhydryl oxidase ERV2 [Zygosaccharomyces bailii]